MSFKIELITKSLKDYKKLDWSIKKVIKKKIDELSEKPFLGEELGHKHNIDLTGYYKIYVAKKSYRIVYRLITTEEVEIIEIWGIGKREKEEIYKLIGKRILNNK